jgi:hypothetical protein
MRISRVLSSAGCAAALAALVTVPAAQATPIFGNPGAGKPASDAFVGACETLPAGVTAARACMAAAVVGIDAARAGEGVGPITLPGGFATEPVPTQLFVLANLERVDRGLAPFPAMSPQLNALSRTGANDDADPEFAIPFPGLIGNSNWSGKGDSALLDTYDWMYDDDLNSGTGGCDFEGESGCWVHRDAIIGFPHQYTAKMLMGAAVAYGTALGTSMTEEFIGGDRRDTAGNVKWAPLANKIPVAVAGTALALSGGPAAGLRMWASGRTMTVAASFTGPHAGWSVSLKKLTIKAGHTRVLTVRHTAGGTGSSATLLLYDGRHTVSVVVSP